MTDILNLNIPTKITKIKSNFLDQKKVELFLKRDDLIHAIISGNKWRKLKYNLQAAKSKGYNTILSYGGPYSNHLHALSYTCDKMGFNSIGVVRNGKNHQNNPTLSFCISHQMTLYHIDRLSYRKYKYDPKLLEILKQKFGKFYVIPEGGNNLLGVKGCEEILRESTINYDYVCAPVGTGCTASGLIKSMRHNQKFLGFTPFKKTVEQYNSIVHFCHEKRYNNWELIADNHFGGFGQINNNLINFVHQFKMDHGVALDYIYMGKLFYSLFNLIKQDFFPQKTKLLILHTGGLQGVNGCKMKNL
tara:strand:- start:1357 stop:2265 length:909 start_codon:yes stop_codon:yes gene_type:complete